MHSTHSISCQSNGVTHYIALGGSNAHLWENESEKSKSHLGVIMRRVLTFWTSWQWTSWGSWIANSKLLLELPTKARMVFILFNINFYSASKCWKGRTKLSGHYLTSWIIMLQYSRPWSSRRLKWRGPIITTVSEDVENPKYSYTAGKNYNHHRETVGSFLKKINIYSSYTVAILLLGLYTRKMKVYFMS